MSIFPARKISSILFFSVFVSHPLSFIVMSYLKVKEPYIPHQTLIHDHSLSICKSVN